MVLKGNLLWNILMFIKLEKRALYSFLRRDFMDTFYHVMESKNVESIKIIIDTLDSLANMTYDGVDMNSRCLSLSSDQFLEHFFGTPGCLEFLLSNGFQQGDTSIYLPFDDGCYLLLSYRDALKTLLNYLQDYDDNRIPEAASHPPPIVKSAIMKSWNKMLQGRYMDFHSYLKVVSLFEQTDIQGTIRDAIPMDVIKTNANKLLNEDEMYRNFGYDDCLFVALLDWFKNNFEWFNAPECPSCHKKMGNMIMEHPSKEEQKYYAGTAEVYSCKDCNTGYRFPRYNHPLKILETGKGRCGEWAILFSCICRLFNIRTRFMVDFSDHVWIEAYSENFGRWIHADPCENVYDKPLLYEVGWKKRISFVLGFSFGEVKDLTWRYTNDIQSVMSRRDPRLEMWLNKLIEDTDKQLKKRLSPMECRKLKEISIAEDIDIIFSKKDASNLGSRISGSIEWKKSRGEA